MNLQGEGSSKVGRQEHDVDSKGIPIEGDGRVQASVRIVQARALSYRVPGSQARPRPTNFIVELTGEREPAGSFVGIGEGQPRGSRTGDNARGSWDFLVDAIERLEGTEMPVSDPRSSVKWIQEAMRWLADLAAAQKKARYRRTPYRGTLLAVEMALLDLAARSQDVPLVALLGQARQFAPKAPPEIRASMSTAAMADTLSEQVADYTLTRVVAPADLDGALAMVRYVTGLNRNLGVHRRPIWIVLAGWLPAKEVWPFLIRLIRAVRAGEAPRQLIVQNLNSPRRMAVIQRWVDTVIKAARADLDIRLMSSWEPHGRSVYPARASRVFDLRPAQVGSLLGSVNAVRAALKSNPNTMVVLSRMPAASRITASALRHLALALPRVDAVEISASVESLTPITYGSIAEGSSPQNTTTPAFEEPEVSTAESPETDIEYEDEKGLKNHDSHHDSDEHAQSVDDPEENVRGPEGIRSVEVHDESGLGVRLNYSELINSTTNYAIFPQPPAPTWNGKQPRQYSDTRYIRPLGSYAVHGHVLEREALAYGLSTRRFSKATFHIEDGKTRTLPFRTARSPLTGITASSIVRHKETTRILLQRAGIPVPQGRTFSGEDPGRLYEYAKRIGYPVVLKPAAGSMGVGVTANIRDESELRSALTRFKDSVMKHDDLIVEQHIHGRDYRIMVLGDRVIAAVERIPASVVGDGQSSVAELILAKNAFRRKNPHLGPLRIKWNSTAIYEVTKAGLTGDSVLPDGRRLFLNSANNLTQGGDSVDVLDEMHPSIIEASVAAVRAVPGLAYCGVDFLLEDHRQSLESQSAAIIELNAVAAIPVAEYPMFGTPRPLSEEFILECIRRFGLKGGASRSESLNLRLQVKGKLSGVGYSTWFARRAREYGCRGWIRTVSHREVEIRLSGSTAAASALVMAAALGPARARPTSVYTTHVAGSVDDGFRVLHNRRLVRNLGAK